MIYDAHHIHAHALALMASLVRCVLAQASVSVNVSAGLDAHEDGDGGARLFVSGYDLPTGEDPTQVTIEVVECDAASPTSSPQPRAARSGGDPPAVSSAAHADGGNGGSGSGGGDNGGRASGGSGGARGSGGVVVRGSTGAPSLRVLGWKSGQAEALLFIHGWQSAATRLTHSARTATRRHVLSAH
jgi:hypothetical protein